MKIPPDSRGMDPIRSLQIGAGWFREESGGLERVFCKLTEHLPRVGVSARGLVVSANNVAADSRGQISPFARPDEPIPLRWKGARRAVHRELAHHRPDLVAGHFALYTFPVLDLFARLPFVVHFHGPWSDEGAAEGFSRINVRAKEAIERVTYRRSDRCIVLSRAFGRILTECFDVAESRIRIVPGGVEVSRFETGISQTEARERLGWPVDRPVILAVRRLARRMGIENLIQAMSQIRGRVPDALLLIAGKGPLAASLRAQIGAAGLEKHVRLLGFVAEEELPLAYRGADVTIVPSMQLEGFGLVTIESLAAGTPVFVAPVGGLPETVGKLSKDLILADNAPSTIAAVLSEVLLGSMPVPDARRCQEYVREHFDWPVIARKVRSVYEEVL